MGAWMNRIKGLNTIHVPYRGGAQAVDRRHRRPHRHVLRRRRGRKSAINSGTVKAFAVTGDARSAALPDVPTFKEAGVTDFDLASWTVFMAPKGTPADVLVR